jgi:hypothetical protein
MWKRQITNVDKIQLVKFEADNSVNTLRTGDADLCLYAYKQIKYPVPNVLIASCGQDLAGSG